ncbi:MAG: UvrD-helicase domain-containing protein [Treponema sp.]|nr:UvrD-helicase domain-containing protein [Treponema sp.]
MPRLNLKNSLNEPQYNAVTSLEGPVLIIAGAGSGKTRVITYRIAHMLERGIPQSAILALTFTNKAAKEMETRVKELTGKKLQSLTVSTFHAFGVKILKEEIETLGYRKNFSIYDETDKTELIKECLRDIKHTSDGVDLYALGQLFSNIKIGRYEWGAPDFSDPWSSGIIADYVWEPVYDEYQRSLKIYNALDFDDLLTVPIELFEKNPQILEKYRSRYRYIMVDEFQDTSFIQYKLMKLLAQQDAQAGKTEITGMGNSNICVVGDDDQSIYSWRGANYENLIRFEKDFPGTTEIKLEQNYRSTTTILEAANGVISNNTNRKEKHLWTGGGSGKPIELFYPENESEEAAFIASRIKEMRFTENLKYDNFGVLVRTNSQIDCIEEAFLAENIPCKVSGGTSFFERKEIKDILSYLHVIANPDDDVNLMRIINTPRRGIGKTSIAMLSDIAKKNRSSLWDSLSRLSLARDHGQDNLFGKNKGEIESFKELIENLREDIIGKKDLSLRVNSMVDTINYWSYLVSEFSKDEKKAKWKFGNINYLIEMIRTWENNPDNLETGLYAYLNRISLLTRADGDDNASDPSDPLSMGKVNLMTIHASKGLEFPVVFIAGAESGIIPHERSLQDGDAVEDDEAEDDAADGDKAGSNTAGNSADADPAAPGSPYQQRLEEERRLFYVAITRARDKLYITSCRRRKRMQSVTEQQPSPFLTEIPQHLIENYETGEADDEEAAQSAAKMFFEKMKEKYK